MRRPVLQRQQGAPRTEQILQPGKDHRHHFAAQARGAQPGGHTGDGLQVRRPAARLLQQAGVLQCDGGLIGEQLQDANLILLEGIGAPIVGDVDHADDLPVPRRAVHRPHGEMPHHVPGVTPFPCAVVHHRHRLAAHDDLPREPLSQTQPAAAEIRRQVVDDDELKFLAGVVHQVDAAHLAPIRSAADHTSCRMSSASLRPGDLQGGLIQDRQLTGVPLDGGFGRACAR